MSALTRRRVANVARSAAPPVMILLGTALLFIFPPGKYNFYPQCPIYEYLHLQCPGCGTTRALAALLHGQIAEALRFNALTTLLVAIYALFCYLRFIQRKPFTLPRLPSPVVPAAIAITVLFGIVRNLGHL